MNAGPVMYRALHRFGESIRIDAPGAEKACRA